MMYTQHVCVEEGVAILDEAVLASRELDYVAIPSTADLMHTTYAAFPFGGKGNNQALR